jgi:hypothetical protein
VLKMRIGLEGVFPIGCMELQERHVCSGHCLNQRQQHLSFPTEARYFGRPLVSFSVVWWIRERTELHKEHGHLFAEAPISTSKHTQTIRYNQHATNEIIPISKFDHDTLFRRIIFNDNSDKRHICFRNTPHSSLNALADFKIASIFF